MLAALAPFLLFSAFLLLLLVSISAPIIKTIYIFKLYANVAVGVLSADARSNARFGVWGYCVEGISVSILGQTETTPTSCSKRHLGYDLSGIIGSANGYNPRVLSKALTAVLVLHPIACGLTFLALTTSFAMLRPGTARGASILTLIFGLLATLVTTAVFLVDVIMVAVVRTKVHNESDGVIWLTFGNAVWMALGATVALWLSLTGACAGICGSSRGRYGRYACLILGLLRIAYASFFPNRRGRKAGTY
ncbi:pali-domain-containing protein [Neolentinus lepideus HHB14362 ss-1]|uniref:Pali-domain-containing protein n=1 Tax=Neolentinus lepideus HHB14362 ss-1 TaxID=1314782 RepID=A0A165T8M6_9AGAM|nr:pali-domain-containing protein [Neolentinus lepideus HHB14362 ss-1]